MSKYDERRGASGGVTPTTATSPMSGISRPTGPSPMTTTMNSMLGTEL
ncbi:hypothetical protein ACFQ0G_24865 [Streptomyces chiangmaiensis]